MRAPHGRVRNAETPAGNFVDAPGRARTSGVQRVSRAAGQRKARAPGLSFVLRVAVVHTGHRIFIPAAASVPPLARWLRAIINLRSRHAGVSIVR